MVKKLFVLLILFALGFGVYKVFFPKHETVADICIKVANDAFKEKHNRVPAKNDFIDDQVIQNDWYPVFEKCLNKNQQ